MLQTAECAHHLFARYAEPHRSPRDIDAAVSARLGRQRAPRDPLP